MAMVTTVKGSNFIDSSALKYIITISYMVMRFANMMYIVAFDILIMVE